MADLGSRIGLVATGAGAVAVWTDTRAGNDVSLKQDLARAVADATDPRVTSATATALQAPWWASWLASSFWPVSAVRSG